MSSYACCKQGCGASICFDDAVENRLRRTHEWWMCPFGHRQHFVTQTEAERELEAERRRGDRYRDSLQELNETFGTCPFGCGYRSQSAYSSRWIWMLKHFRKVHGNLLPSRMVWMARRENWPKEESA